MSYRSASTQVTARALTNSDGCRVCGSFAGGCIGVLCGITLSALAGRLFGWSVPILPAGIALALGSSLLVGVASGSYPANRASRLNLVDALRFE
jgi:ABC-type antimicrobial peptide transport system permease subunit